MLYLNFMPIAIDHSAGLYQDGACPHCGFRMIVPLLFNLEKSVEPTVNV